MTVPTIPTPPDPSAFRADSPWQSTTLPFTGLETLVPEGWNAHVRTEAPALVTMVCPVDGGPRAFAPTITIVVEQPPEEISAIEDYTSVMVHEMRETFTEPHVVSIDLWPRHDGEGRTVVTAHRDAQHTLVAQQYWAVHESGVATVLTGTTTLSQHLWLQPIIGHVAAGLSIAASLPISAEGAGT